MILKLFNKKIFLFLLFLFIIIFLLIFIFKKENKNLEIIQPVGTIKINNIIIDVELATS